MGKKKKDDDYLGLGGYIKEAGLLNGTILYGIQENARRNVRKYEEQEDAMKEEALIKSKKEELRNRIKESELREAETIKREKEKFKEGK